MNPTRMKIWKLKS